MFGLDQVKLAIGVGVLVFVGTIYYFVSDKIDGLNVEIKTLKRTIERIQADNIVINSNYVTCEANLVKQNNIRMKIQSELDKNMLELNEWKNNVPVN